MSRLILADDHAMFREALRGLIEARLPAIKVVGEASTGTEALDLCRKHQPDLLVLDLRMPGLGGLEVLGELKSASPATRTLVVSQYSDRAYVIRALKLGAKGYVPKKGLAKDLVAAIEALLAGRTYLHPTVADIVVEAAVHPAASVENEELAQLTTREHEVLKLTAEGSTAKDIAKALGISPFTVNRHRANLMEKLDVHSKGELIKLAVRLKLIEP